MMYISVYPIAMSVRNTNVYEEKSIGLFEQDDAEEGDELEHNLSSGHHVRGALLVVMDLMFYSIFPGLGSIPRLSCPETACIRYVVAFWRINAHLHLRTRSPL